MRVESLGGGFVKVTADCGCSMESGQMFAPCKAHGLLEAQEFLDHMKSFSKEAAAAVDMHNKKKHTAASPNETAKNRRMIRLFFKRASTKVMRHSAATGLEFRA